MDLPFEAAGRVARRAFYHREAGLALRAMGRVGERRELVFVGFWARTSLSSRKWGHRWKMDEALR